MTTCNQGDRSRRSRHVRFFTRDDFAEVVAWWDVGVRFVQRPDSRWLQHVLSADSVTVICLVDSRHDQEPARKSEIVAFSQIDRDGDVAWLDMVTHPAQLRTGAASELLLWAANWLHRRGAVWLRASVEPANVPSLNWLRKHGFSKECEEDGLWVLSRSVILQ